MSDSRRQRRAPRCDGPMYAGRSGAICAFKDAAGSATDVYLRDVSLIDSFWVSFAVSLTITVPAFIILFAVLRTWLATSRARRT